jgi:hypothetical protein
MGLGALRVLSHDKIDWSDYGSFVLGSLIIGQYFYNLKHQYLTIEHGSIRKNGLNGDGFRKKINLNDINWIKKYAGEYTLITERQKLKIHMDWIDADSLNELNKILAELNLPPEKTPFAKHA